MVFLKKEPRVRKSDAGLSMGFLRKNGKFPWHRGKENLTVKSGPESIGALMGKQYNKVIKRRRAHAYELRAKEAVKQAIAAAKKRK